MQNCEQKLGNSVCCFNYRQSIPIGLSAESSKIPPSWRKTKAHLAPDPIDLPYSTQFNLRTSLYTIKNVSYKSPPSSRPCHFLHPRRLRALRHSQTHRRPTEQAQALQLRRIGHHDSFQQTMERHLRVRRARSPCPVFPRPANLRSEEAVSSVD